MTRTMLVAFGATFLLAAAGEPAHQAVFHVHFHIIPKFPNRGLGITWSAGSLDTARATELARKMRAEMGVG